MTTSPTSWSSATEPAVCTTGSGCATPPTTCSSTARDEGFVVDRVYEAVDDPGDVSRDADGTWHIRAGATVRVQADDGRRRAAHARGARRPAAGRTGAGQPGARGVADVPAGGVEHGCGQRRIDDWCWCWKWFEHQNMRDDRVEAFTSYLAGGTYEYTYIARATTPGQFVVPPAKAEELYAPEVFGSLRLHAPWSWLLGSAREPGTVRRWLTPHGPIGWRAARTTYFTRLIAMSTVLVAETGRPTGSANSRRMRREDHVPAVVYGQGMEPITISVVRRELRHALSGPAGVNTVLDLTVDGKVYPAIVKELQRHPVRRNVSHVDFLQVNLNEEITDRHPGAPRGRGQGRHRRGRPGRPGGRHDRSPHDPAEHPQRDRHRHHRHDDGHRHHARRHQAARRRHRHRRSRDGDRHRARHQGRGAAEPKAEARLPRGGAEGEAAQGEASAPRATPRRLPASDRRSRC